MDRWFQWIKKYKYIFSILLLILIIGIPMLIHYIFCIPAPLPWLEARWEPGSVLEYYGSVLGFLGTVSLSMLALYQNQEIKKESDKRERILQRVEMRKHIPILTCELDGCSGNYKDIRFSLKNVSNNVANNLLITDCEIFNEQGETILKSNGITNDTGRIPNTICAGERVSLRFNNAEPNGSNLILIFNVQCEDKFGNQILYKATKYIKDSKKFDGKIEFFEV